MSAFFHITHIAGIGPEKIHTGWENKHITLKITIWMAIIIKHISKIMTNLYPDLANPQVTDDIEDDTLCIFYLSTWNLFE